MEKAKQQVFTELESFRQNSDIVFHQRSKPQKSQSDKGDKFRGSLYRGVSANGKSWQVFIVINKWKWYSGCAETEEKAAAIYDRLAIIFHGLRVIPLLFISYRQKQTFHILKQMFSSVLKLQQKQINRLLLNSISTLNFYPSKIKKILTVELTPKSLKCFIIIVKKIIPAVKIYFIGDKRWI